MNAINCTINNENSEISNNVRIVVKVCGLKGEVPKRRNCDETNG